MAAVNCGTNIVSCGYVQPEERYTCPVRHAVEDVRHVAQMRDREHRVQQFPLPSVLSSLSRQNARPELDLEVATPAFVTMQLRGLPSQTSTYSEGCTLFGHDSRSLTMI